MMLESLAARQAILEHLISSNLLLAILEDNADELPVIETATGRRVESDNDWLLLFVEACT